MIGSYAIEIKKNGKVLANIYNSVSLRSFYDERAFLETLDEIKDMVYNYNKYLSNTDLSDLLLAVRVLQKQDLYGTLRVNQPVMSIESLDLILDKCSSFGIEDPDEIDTDEMYGIIATTEHDMKKNISDADVRAIIDFDNSCITFLDGWCNEHVNIWEEDHERDSSSLNVCEFDFKKVAFNTIDDFHKFLEENKDGFWQAKFAPSGEAITCIV